MTEPNVRPFTASCTHSIAVYRELDKHCRYRNPSFLISCVLSIATLLFFILLSRKFGKAYSSTMLLVYVAVFLISRLIRYFKGRTDQAPQKMHSTHSDPNGSHHLTFLDNGIHYTAPHCDGERILPYLNIRSVFETPNLLVLVLEQRKLLPVEKSSICGGPVSTFVQKLLEASPSIKQKKLFSLLPGKIIHRIFLLLLVASLLLGILWSSPVQNLLHSTTPINAKMSYFEIAESLEALGIHDIPQEALRDLSGWEQEYDIRVPQSGIYKCTNLLCMAGMGTYNKETWAWTPAQTGVFWFDEEAFDLNRMYTNLLLGVQSLDPEVLCFTDIQEDLSLVNWEDGTGTQTVTFTFAGKTHTLNADVMYDWYDLEILNDLNRIISKETEKTLYFAWDQGHGYLVFYGDSRWARQFQVATGIRLSKNINLLDALY